MNWAIKKIVVGVALVLPCYFSFSKVEEKMLEIQSIQNDVKEITHLAEKKILDDLVLGLLEIEESSEELKKVTDQIFSKSKKFILLTKIIQTKEISPSPDSADQKQKEKHTDSKKQDLSTEFQFVSEVLVRFSKETLKKILIEENLFYKDKGFNRVLALIELKDKVNRKTYRWWEKDQNFQSESMLVQASSLFYNQMQSILMKYGFYSAHPLRGHYQKRIPDHKSYRSLNKRTAKTLAQFFDAHLMMVGSITIDESSVLNMYEASWDVSLYNATHLRKLEVHKFKAKIKKANWDFLTEPHYLYWVKNFAMELNSIYQTGTLSTQLLTIALKGKLKFSERKAIKKSLIQQIRSIKNLTETLITRQVIQYRADVEGENNQLVQAIQNLNILDFQLIPSLESDHLIVVQVKSKSGLKKE